MGKDLFLLAVFFVTTVLIFSFTTGRSPAISVSHIEQNLSMINGQLFVYKYETSNAEYRRFLQYLKDHNQWGQFRRCNIDSTQWVKQGQPNEEFRTQYHSDKAYDDYPVVNISHDAALAYCAWLTRQYNRDPNRKFQKVIFRLPTETEWVAVANGGLSEKWYPWDSQFLRDRDGKLLCNFRPVGDQLISLNAETGSYSVVNDTPAWGRVAAYTVPVRSFAPMGPYGLYNLCGNVAEMLEEEGIAKGGSYRSGGFDVRIQSRMHYEGPSPDIGFRVLMEVVEA